VDQEGRFEEDGGPWLVRKQPSGFIQSRLDVRGVNVDALKYFEVMTLIRTRSFLTREIFGVFNTMT
jgi:hypothetical protein